MRPELSSTRRSKQKKLVKMASTSLRRHEIRLSTRSVLYQQQLRRYQSRKICPLAFHEGDLVLRLVQSTKGMHNLSPPWEGLFIVSRMLGNGAYYLIDAQEPRKNKADNSDKETEHP
jgi:hypothetical protein